MGCGGCSVGGVGWMKWDVECIIEAVEQSGMWRVFCWGGGWMKWDVECTIEAVERSGMWRVFCWGWGGGVDEVGCRVYHRGSGTEWDVARRNEAGWNGAEQTVGRGATATMLANASCAFSTGAFTAEVGPVSLARHCPAARSLPTV